MHQRKRLNDAENRLWSLITQAAGADQPDALETFPTRAAQLEARSKILTDLCIRQLHVTGAGNDLTLGLPATARWQGGYQKTIAGQTFYPNFPSEEIFTTPDRRTTEGRLVASKPFRLFNGSDRGEVRLIEKGRWTGALFQAATTSLPPGPPPPPPPLRSSPVPCGR